ncbi:MAG: tetratricopeptide repeat protein, partial [Verrucomicrobiae bacterium]|nr:tetratricopeptide repeat protein [Verrucomicrobiae bacterium]
MADIESLKQALAVSPQNVPLILLLANTYLEQFHLDEAREQFERVLAIEANHAAARTGIAQILELNGKTSEAILRLEQVCAQEPDHAPAWFLRAKLSLNEGDAAA